MRVEKSNCLVHLHECVLPLDSLRNASKAARCDLKRVMSQGGLDVADCRGCEILLQRFSMDSLLWRKPHVPFLENLLRTSHRIRMLQSFK